MQSLRKGSWFVLWKKLFLEDWSSTGEDVRRGKGRHTFALRRGRQQGDMSIFGRRLHLDTMAAGVSRLLTWVSPRGTMRGHGGHKHCPCCGESCRSGITHQHDIDKVKQTAGCFGIIW